MIRRLPIFFVLDCSESMAGEKIKKMEEGLSSIVKNLRTDPHALETVFISVIAFAGIAKKITPLLEVISFYPPRLPLGGGTNLGAALDVVMNEIDTSIIKTTPTQKGDWKPIVYLFTDGRPTDNPDRKIQKWLDSYAKKATVIAVGIGDAVDYTVLKKITENVIQFDDTDESSFKKFIAWVTASIVAQSKSVGENTNPLQLTKMDSSVLNLAKQDELHAADNACVTLVGRCQNTGRAYLIKYDKKIRDTYLHGMVIPVVSYELSGCFPLDEEYFAWSDTSSFEVTVHTSELVGSPGCPHCGNIVAFAMCSCGKLLCINGPGLSQCPWCEQEVMFGQGSEDGFDITRGRG